MQCFHEISQRVVPGNLTRFVVDDQSPLDSFNPNNGWSVKSTVDFFHDFGDGPFLARRDPFMILNVTGFILPEEGPGCAYTGIPWGSPERRIGGGYRSATDRQHLKDTPAGLAELLELLKHLEPGRPSA